MSLKSAIPFTSCLEEEKFIFARCFRSFSPCTLGTCFVVDLIHFCYYLRFIEHLRTTWWECRTEAACLPHKNREEKEKERPESWYSFWILISVIQTSSKQALHPKGSMTSQQLHALGTKIFAYWPLWNNQIQTNHIIIVKYINLR